MMHGGADVSAVRTVREFLRAHTAEVQAYDADGLVRQCAVELQRRATKLAEAGFDVRVSDAVAPLCRRTSIAQEVRG